MIIKKIAFGNKNEAFIESRLKEKTNIIFSKDNNRGKTLLMQSMVHAIGYESIFPSGFNPKLYYFYANILINNTEIEFLRKGNAILVLNNQMLFLFNSISEFKYYFDKELISIPKIDKDGELKLADLSLFYELFFLGQDKRNTSNLIIKGLNTKIDFLNMIYSMMGVSLITEDKYDIDNIKKEKAVLDSKIKAELKKISIIKSNPILASFISSASNNIDFKNISNQLTEIHKNITEFKKQRNREENRKIKLENLIIELNSLNRNLDEGKVKCADCGSNKIVFSNDDIEFEVSNTYVRHSIIQSIKENIALKTDIILELNESILKEQRQLNKLLDTTSPEAKNYILFQDDFTNTQDIDKIVIQLQEELNLIDSKIKNNEAQLTSNKSSQKRIISSIITEMKRYYRKINPEGTLVFDDIFTKNTETYSGSEGQEYYFCKLLALNNITKHSFPIIIDSFREGELSSSKEALMIDEYKNLNKQVILTSTLKKEEYDTDKYFNIEGLNVIDYSELQDSKILQEEYVEEFLQLLGRFGVN